MRCAGYGTGRRWQPERGSVRQFAGIAVQSAATATNGSGTYTATFVVYASVMPPALSTGGTNGACYNANQMQLFDTITLPLSTAAGVVATTNKVYSSGSTPAKGALPYLYIYSIGASGATLTNYSVWANNL